MATKSKSKAQASSAAYPRKVVPCVSGPSDDEKGRAYAELVNSPEFAAYRLITTMQPDNLSEGIDAPTFMAALRDDARAANEGDMKRAEAMLVGQASALQALFVRLSERAMQQDHMPNIEGFMRLALRAQAQCRATVEALAEIRNPRPVAFVKQANIANGPQQVNNGRPARAGEFGNEPNKLLEKKPNEWLDTGATCKAVGGNQAMEAVGAGYRAEDSRRQGARADERL